MQKENQMGMGQLRFIKKLVINIEVVVVAGGLDHTTKQFTSRYNTQPSYGPFAGTTRVSRCQKRTSGLHGARED